MLHKRRYKEKTPKALNDLLLSTSYFKTNWKAIPTTYKLLNCILHWNNTDAEKKGSSEITRQVFFNLYGVSYPQAILALETAGLLIVTRIWRKGHCYKYLLTAKAHDVLDGALKEYIHILQTDATERRRNQIRISKRGYNKKVYGDIRDDHKNVIDGITFCEDDLNQVCDRYPKEKSAHVRYLIVNILEKNYSDLKYNQKDNRIWTPYAQLPAEVKAIIDVRGLEYLISSDIRSCYPSCWARYVVSTTNNPEALLREQDKYETLFLDKYKDPKSILASQLGIDRTEIKEVLIQYFNGRKVGIGGNNPFRKFDTYLKSEFPLLYTAWKQTDIKQTGNNIGRMFETKLMLDGSIYAKAKELGMILGYENDGFSLYGNEGSNVDALLDFIEKRSFELLGFNLVLVQKDNRELLSQLLAQTQMERIFSEVQDNDKQLAFTRKRNHSRKVKGKPDWTPYYELKRYNETLLGQLTELSHRAFLVI
jgi:hypothetical protein